jgi:hypothetical protein
LTHNHSCRDACLLPLCWIELYAKRPRMVSTCFNGSFQRD